MTERQVAFEASIYSPDAIQRVVYKLSDRLSCDIIADGPIIRCTVHLASQGEEEAEVTVADFRNEVLDETLRERIRDETREVRNVILALAFSNTGLVETTDT